jgi:hypothetical protein
MRYIKKLALYSKSPMDDKFSFLQDSRIVTNSISTMQLPTGPSSSRPTTLVDGTVRYNSTIKEFEVYNSANPGFTSPWQIIRTIKPAKITPQNLGYGNYNDYIFGPLAYTVDTTRPQNLLVFVDNVYQIPTTNYTLTTNPSSVTANLSIDAPSSTTTLYLNTLTNIDVGKPGLWRTVTAPSGLQANTTVTSVNFHFSTPNNGYAVGISLATTGIVSSGTAITVNYGAGTYIQFTGPVPDRQVFALLGFDGYFPAGPSGNIFEP